MRRSDTQSWTDYTEDTGTDDASESMPVSRRRRPKDTDLSDIPSAKRADDFVDTRSVSYADDDQPARRRRPKDTDLSLPANQDAQHSDNQTTQAQQKPETKKKGAVSEMIMSVLSGNILSRSEVTRAYPYMIFVSVLAFIYIANIFRTQSIYREHAALTEQVKELRAKSMTIASDKMKATRQSNIMTELARRGIELEESLTPNKVIPKRTTDESSKPEADRSEAHSTDESARPMTPETRDR